MPGALVGDENPLLFFFLPSFLLPFEYFFERNTTALHYVLGDLLGSTAGNITANHYSKAGPDPPWYFYNRQWRHMWSKPSEKPLENGLKHNVVENDSYER